MVVHTSAFSTGWSLRTAITRVPARPASPTTGAPLESPSKPEGITANGDVSKERASEPRLQTTGPATSPSPTTIG